MQKPLIKLGEAITIQASDIQQTENVLSDPMIVERFAKFAKELKAVAPKADDFLYFSAIMLTAAEASLLNDDGTAKKDSTGREVTARWEKKGDSWKWICSDKNLRPYKNNNGDIFPEEELLKAYRNWIGKPLCLDHKSSSVDMIRGLIVDTYYDHANKRVIGLCALDKKNYPDLARKVATGYATCVSMGTAVSYAICSDCSTVARTEADFCNCMRRKSCYGEINVGLSPIELSIVVNGADPKAKIRHIIAAADHVAKYIESKELEFSKLAQEDSSDEEFESGLDKILKQLDDLKEEIKSLKEKEQDKEDTETKEYPEADEEMKADKGDVNVKEASFNLNLTMKELSNKIDNLSERVNKLYFNEEKYMTAKTAYFQGGGGVNEPTPGKPKYEKEDSESLRNGQDKQMVGQMNTGPVDGMHPGYESFGESEEARKKRLQRLAEVEERKLRREAALEKAKKAYFQGGGGVNEPTPGKPKYEKEDADSIRDDEDKQMVGQAPFPGVGAVDGLHPSPASVDVKDELKRKQMLSRASKLTAKFVKAANSDGSDNLADSRWDVYADKKLVLTATVKDITGTGRVASLYDSVATENFGRKLMSEIREKGIEKVAVQFKSAQMAPAVTPPPAAMPAAEPAMEMPAEMPEASKDVGGNGDPSDKIPSVLDELENVAADLREGFEALTNKSGNELGELEEVSKENLPPSMANSVVLQKKLSSALTIGFEKAAKEIEDLKEELVMAQDISNKKLAGNNSYFNELVNESLSESKLALAESRKLLKAFVKYARGTETILKNAKQHLSVMNKTAQKSDLIGKDPTLPQVGAVYQKGDPLAPLGAIPGVPYTQEALEKYYPELVEKSAVAPTAPVQPATPAPAGSTFKAPEKKDQWRPLEQGSGMVRELSPAEVKNFPGDKAQADDCGDLKVSPDGAMEGTPDEVGKAMKAKEATQDLASMRAKVAQKAMQFSDMLGKAHKGGVTTQLDVKPAGDLAKVETLEEQQKAMLDVANAPPRIRKAAEEIQQLVLAGHIDPAQDFPSLISNGLDKDAVAYWKKFWGQAKDGGSEFASELVKEHQAKKVAAEKEEYRVKVARAYDLAYQMAAVDMIKNNRPAINQQVNELMGMSDESFGQIKAFVEKQPLTKTASVVPQVGLMGVPEVTFTETKDLTLAAELSNALSSAGKRKF